MENKMKFEIDFTEGQKNKIYTEYLRPLKLKISQILLYDTKIAAEFLNKYNDLLENTKDNELLKKITELECEIIEYEKGIGKRKIFEDKSKTIIMQIKKIMDDSEQMDVEEFENKAKELFEKYKENFSNYSFKDKNSIDEKFYELQAKLILKKIEQKDLKTIEINKEDKIGLIIYLNKEIDRLQVDENPQTQNYIKKLKYNLMSGVDAVDNIETWKILKDLQNGENEKKEIVPKSNELMVVNQSKNKKGIMWKIFGKFSKKSQETKSQELFTLNKLPKITIDLLAANIPQNILEDWENEKRAEKKIEGNMKTYLPDARAYVCDFFLQVNKSQNCYKVDIDDNGVKKTIIFRRGNKRVRKFGCVHDSTMINIFAGYNKIGADLVTHAYWWDDYLNITAEKNFQLIKYAKMLDGISGTNYSNTMLGIYENAVMTENGDLGYTIFEKLYKSLKRLEKEYRQRGFDILARDEAQRNAFYNKNSFKRDIKVDFNNREENEMESETKDNQNEMSKNNNQK